MTDEKIIERKSPMDEAKELLIKMEAVGKRFEENVEKVERLQAENLLSGHSEAGSPPPAPKEETPKEYIARVMRDGHA